VNTLYDRDRDLDDLHDIDPQDREISLGTTTIIGIFLGLALLCGAFFGFGYSLGRRSAPPTTAASASAASDAVSSDTDSDNSKPSPASPLTPSAANSRQPSSTDAASDATDQPAATSHDVSAQTTSQPQPALLRTVVSTTDTTKPDTTKRAEAPSKPGPPPPPAPAVSPTGTAVVQVAAVSHQEDANILATALKKRGYTVAIHQTPQDKLLHVQVGPFATKKDADAMRLRLQSDGYNAIVK
jgi:DedD protein